MAAQRKGVNPTLCLAAASAVGSRHAAAAMRLPASLLLATVAARGPFSSWALRAASQIRQRTISGRRATRAIGVRRLLREAALAVPKPFCWSGMQPIPRDGLLAATTSSGAAGVGGCRAGARPRSRALLSALGEGSRLYPSRAQQWQLDVVQRDRPRVSACGLEGSRV